MSESKLLGDIGTKDTSEYLELEVLPDGNMKVTLTKEGREYLEEDNYWKDRTFIDNWTDLMDEFWCNGWSRIRAEDLGFLIDDQHPLITCDFTLEDDGSWETTSKDPKVWYYPTFATTCPIEELLKEGFVIFELNR